MIEEIAEEFYRIEMPLPEHFLRSVNAYVLRDRDRNLIIDAGLQDDRCMDTMQGAIKKLGIDLEKTDFFITHGHGDHDGLIPRLVYAGSIIYLNRLEADYIQRMESDTFFLEVKDLYQASGLPEDGFEKVISLLVRPNLTSIDTPRFQLLGDGDAIARERYRFICVDTPGHSKRHMCLYEPDKKMLVSGDHLLKNVIPPLFGTIDNDNPLKEYLLSLDKVYGLDIDIVLPGHGQPFRNTRQRIEEIKEHHHQQNRKILSILREGSKNMYETSLQMTQKRNRSSTTLLPILQSFHAVHQVFTHLKYLEEEGRIERRTEGKVAIYSLPETC